MTKLPSSWAKFVCFQYLNSNDFGKSQIFRTGDISCSDRQLNTLGCIVTQNCHRWLMLVVNHVITFYISDPSFSIWVSKITYHRKDSLLNSKVLDRFVESNIFVFPSTTISFRCPSIFLFAGNVQQCSSLRYSWPEDSCEHSFLCWRGFQNNNVYSRSLSTKKLINNGMISTCTIFSEESRRLTECLQGGLLGVGLLWPLNVVLINIIMKEKV